VRERHTTTPNRSRTKREEIRADSVQVARAVQKIERLQDTDPDVVTESSERRILAFHSNYKNTFCFSVHNHETTGTPTHHVDEKYPAAPAIDLAQNRPLWRLMYYVWRYALGA